MAKKPKFKPVVTRIRLSYEQAVLACNCSKGTDPWTGFKWVTDASYKSTGTGQYTEFCNNPALKWQTTSQNVHRCGYRQDEYPDYHSDLSYVDSGGSSS